MSHISDNLDNAAETICVFLMLSPAAKDLLLALREEALREDLAVKAPDGSSDSILETVPGSLVVGDRYGSEFGRG